MFVGRGLKRSCRERSLEVVTAEEADLGIEVVADLQVLRARAVAIRHVVELRLVAVVVSVQALGLRPRPVRADVDVLIEGERRVHAVGLIRPRRHRRHRTVREHRADRAAPQDVALDANDGEVGVFGVRDTSSSPV